MAAKRWWVLPVLGVVVAGCGGGSAPDTSADRSQPARPTTIDRVIPPDVTTPTRMLLFHGSTDDKVKVGDEWEYVSKIFRAPRGAYDINDLPPGFNVQDYRARGWETNTEGFGAILYQDRLAAAVYRIERAQEDRLQEILGLYTRWFGESKESVPPELIVKGATLPTGLRVRYWFWHDSDANPKQRLMICAVQSLAEGLNITVGMGDVHTMDALGMSPTAAKSDQAKAQKALEEQAQTQSAK